MGGNASLRVQCDGAHKECKGQQKNTELGVPQSWQFHLSTSIQNWIGKPHAATTLGSLSFSLLEPEYFRDSSDIAGMEDHPRNVVEALHGSNERRTIMEKD
jgi:hypothetical protein